MLASSAFCAVRLSRAPCFLLHPSLHVGTDVCQTTSNARNVRYHRRPNVLRSAKCRHLGHGQVTNCCRERVLRTLTRSLRAPTSGPAQAGYLTQILLYGIFLALFLNCYTS